MKCNRREFLKTGGTALACTCLGGLCLHSCSPFSSVSNTTQVPASSFRLEAGQVVLDLQKTPDLTAIGGSVKLEFSHPDDGASTKIILVHTGRVTYLAFGNTCTHKGKELEYDHAERKLQCVSGHSEFDLSGIALGGNAENPLKSHQTELKGDTLFVKI